MALNHLGLWRAVLWRARQQPGGLELVESPLLPVPMHSGVVPARALEERLDDQVALSRRGLGPAWSGAQTWDTSQRVATAAAVPNWRSLGQNGPPEDGRDGRAEGRDVRAGQCRVVPGRRPERPGNRLRCRQPLQPALGLPAHSPRWLGPFDAQGSHFTSIRGA